MTKKLAIVISGAVSLGSYEAGVMYELLEAIAHHNEALQADDPQRVIIDVITGASAGAMTAGILSQQLYYGGSHLRDPYNNPLFNSWVKRVNIDELLNVKQKNHKYSLLSSDVVDDIGAIYIQENPGNSMNRHPAASDTLRIGLAMSNLNGFPQEIQTATDEDSFGYSCYKDQFICQLRCVAENDGHQATIGQEPNRTVLLTEMEPHLKDRQVAWMPMASSSSWPILRMMALSSGAFPFAFRSRRICRDGGSSTSLTKKRDSSHKAAAGDQLHGGNYLYTDGGVFENEPVGMAASLAKDLDSKLENPTRSYLFVAPGKRKIDADPFFNRDDDLLTMAVGLASAVFGQSRFQQWITQGLEGNLFTVTSSDADLIGDVFSAFAGFLEYDFRAYDYNIGRRMARKYLQDGKFAELVGDFKRIDPKMPMIDWPECEDTVSSLSPISSSPVSSPFTNESIQEGYGEYETDRWKKIRDDLAGLAAPIIIKKDGRKKRSQLLELRNLMIRVNSSRRQLIADQINARIDSLVDFVNEDYFDKIDAQRRSRVFQRLLRQFIFKPLVKCVLKSFIRPFLAETLLNPVADVDRTRGAAYE